MHLILNNSGIEFITSDDPVIVHNQYAEGVKYRGVIGWAFLGPTDLLSDITDRDALAVRSRGLSSRKIAPRRERDDCIRSTRAGNAQLASDAQRGMQRLFRRPAKCAIDRAAMQLSPKQATEATAKTLKGKRRIHPTIAAKARDMPSRPYQEVTFGQVRFPHLERPQWGRLRINLLGPSNSLIAPTRNRIRIVLRVAAFHCLRQFAGGPVRQGGLAISGGGG